MSLSGLNGARLALGLLAVGILAGGAGCAGVPASGSGTREEIVARRAQERWNALLEGDVARAYRYFSPATRQVLTLLGYASSIRVGFWRKAKVDRVECPEADVCDVHVTIEYAHGSTISTPLLESWAQSGGEWWYVRK